MYQAFDGYFLLRQFSDDLTARENKGAVTKARDFLEVGRDDDDAKPCLERCVEQAVDFRLRANVYSSRWIFGDENLAPDG